MRGNQAPYGSPNIGCRLTRYSSVNNTAGQARRLAQLPALVGALCGLLRRSDFVLLRSPGHPALIARLLADVLRVPHITKWAGFFGAFAGERFPRRVERRLVGLSRQPVLVYGPVERLPFISFVPAVMSGEELSRARELQECRAWGPPWRLLSVGRLSDEKGFDLALRGLARFRELAPDLSWTFTLIGDGLAAPALRELAQELGIGDRVAFRGALNFETVQEHYARAHAVIMPGVQEGWPKPIVEAWAHGAVAIAAVGGIVPWIMQDPNAGVTFAPAADGLATALMKLFSDPHGMERMSRRGPELAQQLSLESFATRLERVLVESCGL